MKVLGKDVLILYKIYIIHTVSGQTCHTRCSPCNKSHNCRLSKYDPNSKSEDKIAPSKQLLVATHYTDPYSE